MDFINGFKKSEYDQVHAAQGMATTCKSQVPMWIRLGRKEERKGKGKRK